MNREEFILDNELYARNLARKFARSWDGHPYVMDNLECEAIESLVFYTTKRLQGNDNIEEIIRGGIRYKREPDEREYGDKDKKFVRVRIYYDLLDILRKSKPDRSTITLQKIRYIAEVNYLSYQPIIIELIGECEEFSDEERDMARLILMNMNANDIARFKGLVKSTVCQRLKILARKLVSRMGYPEGVDRDLVDKRIRGTNPRKKGRKGLT